MSLKLAFFVGVTIGLSGCMESMYSMHDNDPERYKNMKFKSEGERLYFTGVSSSGDRMIPIGGHHHMRMHGGSCVTCHGIEKEGGMRMWPRFWVVAPALTLQALSQEHNDGHVHASYDKAALRNAIVNGINPDGKNLHNTMPRWKMSNSSLEALTHYLIDHPDHSH